MVAHIVFIIPVLGQKGPKLIYHINSVCWQFCKSFTVYVLLWGHSSRNRSKMVHISCCNRQKLLQRLNSIRMWILWSEIRFEIYFSKILKLCPLAWHYLNIGSKLKHNDLPRIIIYARLELTLWILEMISFQKFKYSIILF